MEEELTVLLNQGPNGDYEGGRVKGKFVSNDNGKTWIFQKEDNQMKQNKSKRNRIIGWTLICLAIGFCCLQMCYLFIFAKY